MSEAAVHLAKFDGHECGYGNEVVERDAPFCGLRPADPRLTQKESEVTCRRCIRMITAFTDPRRGGR